MTTGETTATVGTGSTTPTVETTPTETTVTGGGTTATVGGTTPTTEPTVSTTPTETTVTGGGTTATVGGGTTVEPGQGGTGTEGSSGESQGNSSAGATTPPNARGQIGGAAQTANLPPTIKSLRLLRATKGQRESTRVVAEIGDTSRGFRFALPDSVTQDAHGSIAEMAGGKPLPAWLVYHPEDFSFTATAVPTRGLPVTAVVTTVRANGTTHRISVTIRP